MNLTRIFDRCRRPSGVLRYLLLLCGFVLFGACDTVTTSQPMGERPKSMSFEERQLWEGIWLEPGGKDNAGAQIVTIRVVDRKSGMLKVGFLASDYLSYQISDFFIRETGRHIYANNKADKGFNWLRVEVTGHHMLLWLPRAKKFREMVKNGKLPGAVSEGGWSIKVYLEDLTAEHLALIESTEEYFDGPFVLTKVGNRQYSPLDWQDGE